MTAREYPRLDIIRLQSMKPTDMTPSQQARADAVADAETLRREMLEQAASTRGETSTGEETTWGARVRGDANCANAAFMLSGKPFADLLSVGGDYAERCLESAAFNDARRAFRAVPGLREED